MTKFRGFEQISNLKYEQRTFICKGCTNECDVTEIKPGDTRKLYYGDRCEKYSGKHTEKTSLTDYFHWRENELMNYHGPNKGEDLGVARVGLFYDLFPFYATFLQELGFNLVLSEKTNKRIINLGVENTTAEFCFPFKVAFGHYLDLKGKLGLKEKAEQEEVGRIFVPNIDEGFRSKYSLNGRQEYSEWERSHTCLYTKLFDSLIAEDLNNIKIISPHFSLREGNFVKELSQAFGIRKRRISRAIRKGEEAYFNFKSQVMKKGEIAINNLAAEKKKGIVVVGRPYTTYDKGMNLGIAKKISELGFIALPQDFLPLPKEDLSRRWSNEFSIQGQHILNAGNVIARNKNLEAVFLDYYGCGPDSFIKGFFAKEIGKPFLTLQIDEHTADAGLITRLEAFLDSLNGRRN